jgi:hypothetical protein
MLSKPKEHPVLLDEQLRQGDNSSPKNFTYKLKGGTPRERKTARTSFEADGTKDEGQLHHVVNAWSSFNPGRGI